MEDTHAPSHGLPLALYRLEQIEQNTREMVPKDTYLLEQASIKQRVHLLELEQETERKTRRQLIVGVLVALVAPSVATLPLIMQSVGVG